MRKKKIVTICILVVLILLLFTGCIPGDGTYTSDNPAGFFWGIWHGWIAPISLVIGTFKGNIGIYETMNTGWFYDLGFYIAIISGFGGLSLSRKKKSKDKD